MRKFWKTNKFKCLQTEWYDELKKAGFKDVESKVGDELMLTQNAPNAYRQADRLTREAKLHYYVLIYQGVSNNEFDNEIDRLVMTRVSEGYCNVEISNELKLLNKIWTHRKTVMYIKRKYENRWGIRKWEQHQLKSKRVPRKRIQ